MKKYAVLAYMVVDEEQKKICEVQLGPSCFRASIGPPPTLYDHVITYGVEVDALRKAVKEVFQELEEEALIAAPAPEEVM